MPKIAAARTINQAELKRISRRLREEQLVGLAQGRADLSADPKLRANARAGEKLAKTLFTASNADIAEFDKLYKRNGTDLRRVLQKQKALALKRARATKKTVAAALKERNAALGGLATNSDPDSPPFYVHLAQPFSIWPSPLDVMDDSRIEAGSSWAKAKRWSVIEGNATDVVSFFYMWRNDAAYPVTINVDSSISVNGHIVVIAEGGIFPGTRYASITLTAALMTVKWWEDPPTSPLLQDSQRTNIANLETSNGDFFQFQELHRRDVVGEFGVGYKMLEVPAGETAIFEVALWVTYDHKNGEIDYDFSRGDFVVRCPSLLVTVLTAPPS
jgi:hypothetical protein